MKVTGNSSPDTVRVLHKVSTLQDYLQTGCDSILRAVVFVAGKQNPHDKNLRNFGSYDISVHRVDIDGEGF